MQLKLLREKLQKNNDNDEFRSDYINLLNGDIDKLMLDDCEIKRICSERLNSDFTTVFTCDEKYYQVKGYYNSWEGIDFSNSVIHEVKPEQTTITVYVKTKGD